MKNTLLSIISLISFGILTFPSFSQTAFTPQVTRTATAYCAFNNVKVLDIRKYKDDIGYLKVGPFNKKQILHPAGGMEELLQQFAARVTASASEKGNKELLIVVRDFMIEDRPSHSSEIGTCYLRMMFYLGENNQYTACRAIDELNETGSGWDVTKGLQQLAASALTTCILASAADTGFIAIPPQSAETIRNNMQQEYQNYLVYNNPAQKGIYYTFEQFINNTPADTAFVQKDYRTDYGKMSYFYTVTNGKKDRNLDKTDCFAVYNGNRWYLKTSMGLLEMTQNNGDFYFKEIGKGYVRNDGSTMIMFGLMGVMIEQAIGQKKDKKGNVLYLMRLDPATGKGFPTKRLY